MLNQFNALVTAMKALNKAATTSEPDNILPVAENEWNTRPDAESYGQIMYEFEAGMLEGDNLKQDRAYEGSMDLYSRKKDGDGWIPLIEKVLSEHCESCWMLNYHTKEAGTNLFRWEWTFQIEG